MVQVKVIVIVLVLVSIATAQMRPMALQREDNTEDNNNDNTILRRRRPALIHPPQPLGPQEDDTSESSEEEVTEGNQKLGLGTVARVAGGLAEFISSIRHQSGTPNQFADNHQFSYNDVYNSKLQYNVISAFFLRQIHEKLMDVTRTMDGVMEGYTTQEEAHQAQLLQLNHRLDRLTQTTGAVVGALGAIDRHLKLDGKAVLDKITMGTDDLRQIATNQGPLLFSSIVLPLLLLFLGITILIMTCINFCRRSCCPPNPTE